MIQRFGYEKIDGRYHFWTNWYIDQLYLDQPMFKIEDYTIPDEWLIEMFDNKYSAPLMFMPREYWN